jgi:hypothetical protein
MTKRTYGSYTFDQLKELIVASNESESSIDDLCGGDGAASCNIIEDLVARIEELEAKQ